MSSFYEVMIERHFSSAHQLRGYKGKCENLHGARRQTSVRANVQAGFESIDQIAQAGL
jgi:6-pyruvoyltetrahydropterin/6-carboxytetrahydropterin synthase